jgi:hypothetical protein
MFLNITKQQENVNMFVKKKWFIPTVNPLGKPLTAAGSLVYLAK